ncbi:MAG: nucleotidyltransferase domain-containing protein [Elusimicrobia bacterium]|nr:nucleotidyltransferase domain-containing protein [Elusimicrobiota bacterium]
MLTKDNIPKYPLERLWGKKSLLAVLRCLYNCPQELSGREISRRVKLSPPQTHKALRELDSLGLVGKKITSPSYLFKLNTEHWIVTKVLSILFENDKKWLDQLLTEVSRHLPKSIVSLILFGSAAQGQMQTGSDIDLLALVNKEADKKPAINHLVEQGERLRGRYHYPIVPIVMTINEFRERYAQNNPFVRDVVKTGSAVKGKMVTQIL